MRATPILIAAAVVAAASFAAREGASTPSPVGDERLLAAGADEPGGAWLDGFDGRLYADPETGCLRPWREDDPGPGSRTEDVGPLRPGSGDPPILVQDGPDGPPVTPQVDQGLSAQRGPWPRCEHPAARVSEHLDRP
jgi:hypothetical protein